jgi:hypothetical protein
LSRCPAQPSLETAGLAGLLCFLITALIGAAAAATPAMADHLHLLDDRTTRPAAGWRFFTDGVMGGVSRGAMSEEIVAGRPALCLRGQVRLENNGGFVQMALELPPLPASPSEPWQGLEIDAQGNGLRYGLHLRSADMTMPWQSFRASFDAGPQWRTLRLPFADFRPYRFDGTLRVETLRRVGILAIGQAMPAEVCVSRLALYR